MSYREVARERKQFLMTHLQISAIVISYIEYLFVFPLNLIVDKINAQLFFGQITMPFVASSNELFTCDHPVVNLHSDNFHSVAIGPIE